MHTELESYVNRLIVLGPENVNVGLPSQSAAITALCFMDIHVFASISLEAYAVISSSTTRLTKPQVRSQ